MTAPAPPPVSTPPASDEPLTLSWADEAGTAACAERLAALAGVRGAHIHLHGQLGAGKTTFTRHLLRALGVSGRIKSPSYTIVEPYELPGTDASVTTTAWHFDFYRFADPQEWEDAGLRDLFASPGLKLVEWPERAAGLLPPPDLALTLAIPADGLGRRLTVQTHSALGLNLLPAFT